MKNFLTVLLTMFLLTGTAAAQVEVNRAELIQAALDAQKKFLRDLLEI